jgi:putative membrane protein
VRARPDGLSRDELAPSQAPGQPSGTILGGLGPRKRRSGAATLRMSVDAGRCSVKLRGRPMFDILISWLILSGAFYLTAELLPGFELKGGARGALLVAALFGVVNWLIGWLLFVIIGIASLGIGFLLAFLTRWLVNAILLKVVDAVSDTLNIKSFGTAMIGALIISLVGTVGQWLVRLVLA